MNKPQGSAAPPEQEAPLTDAQLGVIAYAGFDDYWKEDSPGREHEAWEASAKAVRAALAASPRPLTEPEQLAEVRAAAVEFYNATVGNLYVRITSHQESLRDIAARAAARLRAALQDTTPFGAVMSDGYMNKAGFECSRAEYEAEERTQESSDAAPAALQGAWISIEEQLPEPGQTVLFWERLDAAELGGIVNIGRKDPEGSVWWDDLHTDRDGESTDCYTVSHWMPLPAAPANPSPSPLPLAESRAAIVGTIGHVGNGKTTLVGAIAPVLSRAAETAYTPEQFSAEQKDRMTEALEFLFLAILTRADADYLDRAMRRSDAALREAMSGWNPPFNWSPK